MSAICISSSVTVVHTAVVSPFCSSYHHKVGLQSLRLHKTCYSAWNLACRLKGPDGSAVGKLEIVRQLLGYDAHSPTAQSVDSGSSSSYASSIRPIASSPVSSHWTSKHSSSNSSSSRRHRPPRPPHIRRRSKPHLARTAAGRDLLESCLPSQAPGSGRVKDTCVHAGCVSAILISGGRAYTAGGSGASSAALLVWDSNRFELLRTISKRSTGWCR